MIIVTKQTHNIPFELSPLTDEEIAMRHESVLKILADIESDPTTPIFKD